MHQIEVALEIGGNGVREGADGLEAGLVVGVDGEVRVEELVGLADREFEGKPAASRGGLGGDVILGEPGVDGIDAGLAGRHELLDLIWPAEMRKGWWNGEGEEKAYLGLRKVLAVVGAGGCADVVQLALKLVEVALDEREAELEGLVGQRRAPEGEAVGDVLAELVHLNVARRGLAEDGSEERSKKQAGGDHGGCGVSEVKLRGVSLSRTLVTRRC